MAEPLLINAIQSKLPAAVCFDIPPKSNDTCQIELAVHMPDGSLEKIKWQRQGSAFQLVGKLPSKFLPVQAQQLEKEVQLLGKLMAQTTQKQLSNSETRFELYLQLANYIVQAGPEAMQWGETVGVELLKLLSNSPNWHANLSLLNGVLSTEKDIAGYDPGQRSNIKKILSLLLNLKAAEKGINAFVDLADQEFVYKYNRDFLPENDDESALKRRAFELMIDKQKLTDEEKGKILERYKSIVEIENLYRYALTHVAQLFMGGEMVYDQSFHLAYRHYVTLSERKNQLGDATVYNLHSKNIVKDPATGQDISFEIVDDTSKFCRGLTLLFAPLKEEGVTTVPNLERCEDAATILQLAGESSVSQSMLYYWGNEVFYPKIEQINTSQSILGMTTYPFDTLKGDAADPDRLKNIIKTFATLFENPADINAEVLELSADRMVEVANKIIKEAALGRKRHYRVAVRVFLSVLKNEFDGKQDFSLLMGGKFENKKIKITHPEILTQYINQLSQEAASSEARTDFWLPLSESAVAVVGGGLLVHGLATNNDYTRYSGGAAAGIGLGGLAGYGFTKLFNVNTENEWIPHAIGAVVGLAAGLYITCAGVECMTGSNPGHEREPAPDPTQMNHVSEFGP